MTEESVAALMTSEGAALLSSLKDVDAQNFLLSDGASVPQALRQGVAEQLLCASKLQKKLPHFYDVKALVERELLEQASVEPVARFRATLLGGESCIELTGGLGSDSLFLSPKFENYTFCEIDGARAALFSHNKKILGCDSIIIKKGDSVTFLQKNSRKYDWIYADPARRESGKKGKIALVHCQPNILDNLELIQEKCHNLALKLSPAYDISQLVREIPWIHSVYIISYNREVREILALGTPSSQGEKVTIHAVGVDDTGMAFFHYFSRDKALMSTTSLENRFLFEPDPAIIKANLVWACGSSFGLIPLTQRGVFLVGDTFQAEFPGRIFKVIAKMPWHRKEVKQYLKQNGITSASVMRRNFPLSAQELKKQYKLGESDVIALLFTTDARGKRVVYHLERMRTP